MIGFYKTYFLLALLLFFTEVFIGIYVHDTLIRPFGGDFLVVILLYCAIKSFIDFPVWRTAMYALVFAYAIEVSQYFHLVYLLGLQNSKLAQIILGTTFSFTDLLAYTFGILLVLLIEKIKTTLSYF
jgi:hypothetical protein